MSLSPTPLRGRYTGAGDLAPLLRFASRSLAERFPLGATWHPGDVVWELRGNYDRSQPIRFWQSDGAVQALAWFVGPGQLWLETTPGAETLVGEAIDWAEDSLRRVKPNDRPPALSIRAFERDLVRVRSLERLGFQRAAPEAVQFEFDLSGALPSAALDEGFQVHDCVGVDVEQRAASHRDAWNDLSRIGIANASSGFTPEIYDSLRRSPVYRPDLDLVVSDPEGRLVANCICWADEASGVGVFEPMGTHPDYRGRRLARVLLADGLRRLKALGLRRARIGTSHFNSPAISAYSAVFKPMDRSSWWARALQA